MVRIGKEYKWEMSHRLPFHEGDCINIHGHSYKMLVVLEGEVNDNKMLIDFYDIDKIVNPLLSQLDHAFLVDSNDSKVNNFLDSMGFKKYVIDDFSTAEDISKYILQYLKPKISEFSNISFMKIRIYETIDAWAESESKIINKK